MGSAAPAPAQTRAITPPKRHLIQLLAALLYNLNLPGFVQGHIYQGVTKAVCVPGLNCYSCPGAIGSCPLGSLQAALAASNRKLPFYLVGTLLAFGALFGRTICGWLCPFGLLQDLLSKIPLPKLHKGRWSRRASAGKYGVLALCVLAIPLALTLFTQVGSPFFCAWLCPAGTLEAGLPLVASNAELQQTIGFQFFWKLGLLLALLLVCLIIYRPFCRFLCPLGALYSFFNRFALLRYRVDPHRCTNCGTCLKVCKLDIQQVSDRECIQCGACAKHCEQGAISFTLHDLLKRSKRAAGKTLLEARMEREGVRAGREACAGRGDRAEHDDRDCNGRTENNVYQQRCSDSYDKLVRTDACPGSRSTIRAKACGEIRSAMRAKASATSPLDGRPDRRCGTRPRFGAGRTQRLRWQDRKHGGHAG